MSTKLVDKSVQWLTCWPWKYNPEIWSKMEMKEFKLNLNLSILEQICWLIAKYCNSRGFVIMPNKLSIKIKHNPVTALTLGTRAGKPLSVLIQSSRSYTMDSCYHTICTVVNMFHIYHRDKYQKHIWAKLGHI